MPSALTHYLFAIQSLKRENSLPFLHFNEDLVRVGTQGPDPFFFYGFVPWRPRNDKEVSYHYGSFLHAQNPFTTVLEFLKVAEKETGLKKDYYMAYLYGFLLHYVLDRAVHPYVYYRSGFDKQGELTGRYAIDHARYESFMDTALLKSTHWNIPRTFGFRAIQAGSDKIKEVSNLFAEIKNPKVSRNQFFEAWKDMRSIEKILHDRWGWKLWLMNHLGAKESLMAGMTLPHRIPSSDLHDYLNESHQEWMNPVTGKKELSSVSDLISQAHEAMRWVSSKLLSIYEGAPVNEFEWNQFFQTINFDGVPEGQQRQLHDSIYLKKRG